MDSEVIFHVPAIDMSTKNLLNLRTQVFFPFQNKKKLFYPASFLRKESKLGWWSLHSIIIHAVEFCYDLTKNYYKFCT